MYVVLQTETKFKSTNILTDFNFQNKTVFICLGRFFPLFQLKLLKIKFSSVVFAKWLSLVVENKNIILT